MSSEFAVGEVAANSEFPRWSSKPLTRAPSSGFTSTPVVFDRKHAMSCIGGLEDVLVDVMKLMVTESRQVHAEIDAAYGRRDGTSLKRSAHKLKGSVSIVGAKDLAARLGRVENFAATNDFDRVAEEFPEIDRQFEELQSRLAEELSHSS